MLTAFGWIQNSRGSGSAQIRDVTVIGATVMWVCQHGHEQVDDVYGACWNCGTEADGTLTGTENGSSAVCDWCLCLALRKAARISRPTG